MRNGKSLGLLKWDTNTIYPVIPIKKTITKEERARMDKGYYIKKRS